MRLNPLHILFTGLFLLLAMACDQPSQVSLRVAHNSWPGYEPLPLAEHKGLYKGVDIRTYRVGSSTEAIRAFNQNIVEVAAVTMDEAISLQSQSAEQIKVIAVLDISNGGDVIIAKNTIGSVQDLKNKRIGVETTALGAFFVSRAVDSISGLTMDDIKVVPVSLDHHFDAFMLDEVDAVVTFEPVKSRILQNKGHVIFDSRLIENEIVDVLVVKQSTAKRKEKEIKALVAGYFETLMFIDKHPVDAIDTMARFEGVQPGAFKKSLSGMRIPDLEENRMLLSENSETLRETVNKLQKFMLANNIIQNTVEAADLLTDVYLPTEPAKP